MNIFKTFEIFLREPLSILKNNIVQIVSFNSPVIEDSGITVTLDNRKTQINVVNNEKVYNLLKTVQNKKEKMAAEKLQIPAQKKVIFGSLTMKN